MVNMAYYGRLQQMEGGTAGTKDNTKTLLMKAAALQAARKTSSASSSGAAIPGIMPNTVNNRPMQGPSAPGRPPAPGSHAPLALARLKLSEPAASRVKDTDFGACPSAFVRQSKAEREAAAAKAAGPAKPPPSISLLPKEKKNKKEKTKDKKDKKNKKNKTKRQSSESESAESVKRQKTKKGKPIGYKGHFMHPSFGAQRLSISIQLQTLTTGAFVIMGQVVDGTVNVAFEEESVVFSDGKIILDGVMCKRDMVRGEVVMQGDGGGNFVLSLDGPDALSPEETKELVGKDMLTLSERVEKKEKKNKKFKAKKRASSSESSDEALQDQLRSYTGHFSHPSFGSKSLSISVELRPTNAGMPTTGKWLIMGQVVDSTVTVTYEGRHTVFSDGKVVLDGMRNKRGSIKGKVAIDGKDGGSFELAPGRPEGSPPEQLEEDGYEDVVGSPRSPSPMMCQPVQGVDSSESEAEGAFGVPEHPGDIQFETAPAAEAASSSRGIIFTRGLVAMMPKAKGPPPPAHPVPARAPGNVPMAAKSCPPVYMNEQQQTPVVASKNLQTAEGSKQQETRDLPKDERNPPATAESNRSDSHPEAAQLKDSMRQMLREMQAKRRTSEQHQLVAASTPESTQQSTASSSGRAAAGDSEQRAKDYPDAHDKEELCEAHEATSEEFEGAGRSSGSHRVRLVQRRHEEEHREEHDEASSEEFEGPSRPSRSNRVQLVRRHDEERTRGAGHEAASEEFAGRGRSRGSSRSDRVRLVRRRDGEELREAGDEAASEESAGPGRSGAVRQVKRMRRVRRVRRVRRRSGGSGESGRSGTPEDPEEYAATPPAMVQHHAAAASSCRKIPRVDADPSAPRLVPTEKRPRI